MVDHPLLLEKLKLYGFDESVLRWIRSYLTNRTQSVFGGLSYSLCHSDPAVLSNTEQYTKIAKYMSANKPVINDEYLQDQTKKMGQG